MGPSLALGREKTMLAILIEIMAETTFALVEALGDLARAAMGDDKR